MKRTVLIGAVALAIAPWTARAVDFTIYPTSVQDGTVWAGGLDNIASQFGIWGSVNDSPYVQAGIHSLPLITAGQVASAELRIPETDNLWSGNGANILTIDWFADHFDAQSDAALTAGDNAQPALSTLGLYRAAAPQAIDGARFASIDVTAAVKDDLLNGRGSFAWRLAPGTAFPDPAAQMYFPTVDNTDGFFPAENRGARLLITLVPEPASAGLMLIGALSMLARRRRPA